MEIDKVREMLKIRFNEGFDFPYERHILFWYDDTGSFASEIDNLGIDNVKVLKINYTEKGIPNNIFKIKYTLEVEDTKSNFLIYSNKARPKNENNWLLDIEEYSTQFRADRSAIVIDEFDMDFAVKEVIDKYIEFFNKKDRKEKFKKLYRNNFSEREIELTMMAVLTKTEIIRFDAILKNVLSEGLEDDNALYLQITKWMNADVFWEFVRREFEFEVEEKSLKKLMQILLVSHLFYSINIEPPKSLKKYYKGKFYNSYVFIEQWMSDMNNREQYKKLANTIDEEIGVIKYFADIAIEKIVEANTFEIFDKYILDKIIKNNLGSLEDYDVYRRWINIRKEVSVWNKEYENLYLILEYANRILKVKKFLVIKERNAGELFREYEKNYYKIDYYYRKFYEYYDKKSELLENELEALRERIENFYGRRQLEELALCWTDLIDSELKENWVISGINMQKDFYENEIKKYENGNEKIFVIISDALRYETAKEVSELLNTEIDANDITIEPMLGTVPSYTKAGMASLLPHKDKMIYRDGLIYINDIMTDSTDNRERILKQFCENAVAIQYNRIRKEMTRDEAREVVNGKQIVYIYHNVIDATGDKKETEINIFDSCRTAIEELVDAVKFTINTLNGNTVYITADHGFLYHRDRLEEYEKLTKKDNDKIIEKTKRYIYTKDSGHEDGCVNINLDYIFKDQGLRALIPKGSLRFKAQGGGSNYVHGGASLQEIMIPLIKYKRVRSKELKVNYVNVELLTTNRKISNNTAQLVFFQREAVNENEKMLPRRIKMAFYDDEKMISNERLIIADNEADKSADRELKIVLTIKKGIYDRKKDYYLRVWDETTEEQLHEIKFGIDIMVSNEFDF